MAITAGTRTQLIGLSVAMLGQAPGTGRLNHWVADIDEGMSVDDLANHIAESEAFQARYPTFSTNEEFAKDFLGDVLHGVPENIMTAAVDLVTLQLNDGVSRGSLVLAVVDALHDIAEKGMDHPAYGDLGMSANALVNKVSVASHYTLNARMEEPSSEVLSNVTADEDSVAMAIDAIDNPKLPPEEPPMGQTYVLSATRDNVPGTDQDDTIIAEPVAQVSNVFIQTLQPFDVINGGDGVDSLLIYDVDGANNFEISNADVSNVEHVTVNAQAGIIADMSEWSGLETVDLQRFAKDKDVEITVDGASVMTSRTYGGDHVEINGSAGTVDLMAEAGTKVMIGSGAHTTSVMVKGGNHVAVGKNSGGSGQSETVTSVSVDGVTASHSADGANTDRMPNIKVHSNAIESVSLANTYGTVAIVNGSDEAEDLMLTVNKYGGQKVAVDHDNDPKTPKMAIAQDGKICVTGDGSAENIMIEVAGDSMFDLASNEVKTLAIMGDGKLSMDVEKFDNATASNTLASVTVSGDAGLTMDLTGLGELTMVDASESAGDNKLTASEQVAKLESVSTGGGKDTVELHTTEKGKLASIDTGADDDMVTVTGAHRKDGLMIDLGTGDDRYMAGADNAKSRVDGGDGMDTLNLTMGSGASYKPEGSDTAMSIYSGFEILDAGGGQGGYDVKALGVDSITFSKTTSAGDDRVVLNNVTSAGVGFSVMSSAKGMEAKATVDYNLDKAAKESGSRFDAVDNGIFTISLTANGGKDDTAKVNKEMGRAITSVKVDDTIQLMVVDSTAQVNSTKGAKASNYENVVCVRGMDGLEEVKITGDAMLVLKDFSHADNDSNDEALNSLKYVDATGNTAGVTVRVGAANDQELEVRGSSGGDRIEAGSGDDTLMGNDGKDTLYGNAGMDKLHGGAGDDTLMGGEGMDTLRGGAGKDTLTGGNDADMYEFLSVSDSRMGTHDVITNFEGSDKIMLSAALMAKFNANIKTQFGGANSSNVVADTFTINNGYEAPEESAHSLTALIGNGNGFFETNNDESGLGREVYKHFVAVVGETMHVDTNGDGVFGNTRIWDHDDDPLTDNQTVTDESTTRTWILLDVDGDGNFNANNDLVIELAGDPATIDENSFGQITG